MDILAWEQNGMLQQSHVCRREKFHETGTQIRTKEMIVKVLEVKNAASDL